MIKIRDYKPNSPEWVMAKFFDCWKRRAWVQMLNYVQPPWLTRHKEPNKVLRLSLNKLVNTEFIQMNANTGIVAVFLVNISKKVHEVRLVREDKRWGLDPSSII